MRATKFRSSVRPHARENCAFIMVTLLVVWLSSACGGGGDPVTPPTPVTPTNPTPTIGPPASITVQTGDAQTSEPGRALSINPSVLIKDAAGLAVPNTAVAFAIDSGGGSLSGGTVTTNNSGLATLGAWTLGINPGRNVLRVTAGVAPAAKIVATASWTGVTATLGELGASGGTITVSRPGSLLDKISITVPAGAFPAVTHFSVLASSSGLFALNAGSAAVAQFSASAFNAGAAGANPFVRGSGSATNGMSPQEDRALFAKLSNIPALPVSMVAVTPIISIVSDGIPSASQDVLIRLPIPRNTGSNVIVVIVDSVSKPIGYLSPVAQDTISVTVNTRGLDASVYALQSPADVAGKRTLSLVVFAGGDQLSVKQLYPNDVSTTFVPTRDSWGIYDLPTSYFPDITAGLTMMESVAFGRYAGGLAQHGAYAPGIYLSKSPVIMLSAIMAEYVKMYYYTPDNLQRWVSYRDANLVNYDRNVLSGIIAYLNSNYPVPLLLTNGTESRMVLAIGWNPANELLLVVDYARPGSATALSFRDGRMQPYVHPGRLDITYTTPVAAVPVVSSMNGLLNQGLARMSQEEEPYSALWKKTAMSSWGNQMLQGLYRTRPDTLFMVDDTTRIWATVQLPVTTTGVNLPAPAGYGLQPSSMFVRDGTTWNSTPVQAIGTSLFVDARGSQTKSFTRTYGFSISAPRETSSEFTWHAWRQVDVVKFGLKITGPVPAKIQVPATFTASAADGPSLPAAAVYEWNFNDGTDVVRVNNSPSVQHTFTEGGKRNIEVKVYHPVSRQMIARYVVQETIEGGFAAWKITNIGTSVSMTGDSPFGPTNGLSSSWARYNQIFDDIKSGLMEGGLVYIPKDTTYGNGTRPRGLYVVDGKPVTAALINSAFDISYPGTTFNWRTGYVRGTLLAYAMPAYRTAEAPSLSERFAETGTLEAGTISGTSWEWLSVGRVGANTVNFPTFTRTAEVQFLGTTATGTLTYVVRNYTNFFTLAESGRYTLTVTFSAIRIQ